MLAGGQAQAGVQYQRQRKDAARRDTELLCSQNRRPQAEQSYTAQFGCREPLQCCCGAVRSSAVHPPEGTSGSSSSSSCIRHRKRSVTPRMYSLGCCRLFRRFWQIRICGGRAGGWSETSAGEPRGGQKRAEGSDVMGGGEQQAGWAWTERLHYTAGHSRADRSRFSHGSNVVCHKPKGTGPGGLAGSSTP